MAPAAIVHEAPPTERPLRIEVHDGRADVVSRREMIQLRQEEARANPTPGFMEDDGGETVVSIILSAAIGLILFGALFALMLSGSEQAALAAQNGTTGDPTGDTLLAVVPAVIGISVGLVSFVLIEKVTGQKIL